ncbi:MAG: hypothetical protein ACSI46_21010 [Gloeotrichia echinulata DVL01]
MSRIRVRLRSNWQFVTHPTHLFERWSKLVGGGIPYCPAIPLTAKRSTVLAGVPRSLDGLAIIKDCGIHTTASGRICYPVSSPFFRNRVLGIVVSHCKSSNLLK